MASKQNIKFVGSEVCVSVHFDVISQVLDIQTRNYDCYTFTRYRQIFRYKFKKQVSGICFSYRSSTSVNFTSLRTMATNRDNNIKCNPYIYILDAYI